MESFVFLVFNTELEALSAISDIDNILQLPAPGIVLGTGEEGLGSITWAIPEQRLDGKWVIPLPPTEVNPSWGATLQVATRNSISSWFDISE